MNLVFSPGRGDQNVAGACSETEPPVIWIEGLEGQGDGSATYGAPPLPANGGAGFRLVGELEGGSLFLSPDCCAGIFPGVPFHYTPRLRSGHPSRVGFTGFP
jgi:hypothetical protein